MPRSILLADDSVTIQKVIELTFMDEDYDVVSVSSGTAAIEKLGELRPDLVIADVHMPGASGYEVCRTAKRVYPDVPVLLLVGTFEPYDDNEAQAAGASSALKKPFDSQELLGTARALLASSAPAASALPVFEDPGSSFEAAPPPLGFEPGFGFEPAFGDDGAPPQPFPTPGAVETQLISNAEYTFDQLDSQAWATPSGGGDLDFGAGFGTSGMSPTVEEPDALDPIDLRTFAPAGPEAETSLVAEASYWMTDPPAPLPEPERTPSFESPDWMSRVEPEPAPSFEPMPAFDAPSFESPSFASPTFDPPALEAEAFPAEPSFEMPSFDSPVSFGQAEAEPLVAELPEPTPAPVPVAEPVPVASAPLAAAPVVAPAPAVSGALSDEDVDRIARRVVELLGEKVVREVAWEVVPDLAELAIKDRLRELEAQLDG